MKLIKFSLTPPIVAISVLFASLCACGATQRYVSKDGSYGADVEGAECYTTLQKAVAACVNGDTVWVKDGFECTPEDGVDTTTGNTSTIRIPVQITLRGETGNWQTGPIIRGRWNGDTLATAVGPNAARCLYITTKNTKVIGFRLLNGATVSDKNGGGVYAQVDAVVTNCFIANCAASYGGGASLKSASLYSSVVSNCYCKEQCSGTYWTSKSVDVLLIHNSGGPAFSSTGTQKPILKNCKFVENRCSVALSNSSNGSDYMCNVRDCCFVSNTVSGRAVSAGYLNMTNCVFTGNSGGSDGGQVACYFKSKAETPMTATCIDCTFSNNLSTAANGSVGNKVTLKNCRIIGNRGGAKGQLNGCNVYNSLIAGNTATGPTVSAFSNETIANCTIVGNTNTGADGGTVAAADGVTLSCVNTIVRGNVAPAADTITIATNCCLEATAQVGTGEGNVTDDPKLVKAGKPDAYHLKPTSTLIGEGKVLDWMSDETDARSKDLAGLPRLTDGKVNIGCYEGIAPMPGLLLLLR